MMNNMMENRKRFVSIIVVSALVLFGVACESGPEPKSAQGAGQKLTEQAFAQQQAAVPYPVSQLKDSLERRNLKERLLRTNDPSTLGYIYLINFGKVIGYYTIKGKVSSTQSQMTTNNLTVRECHAGSCWSNVVDAPGDDGSYGPNEDGMFFFTTEGAFVTTSLDYIWSDQPLPIDVPRLNSKK